MKHGINKKLLKCAVSVCNSFLSPGRCFIIYFK